MDKSSGYTLLTVPKVIAMSSKKLGEDSIRSLYINLLGIWGFRKVPDDLETEFRQLNRQQMIDHPQIFPKKVSFVYHDLLLEKKNDYVGVHMLDNRATITDKAICCFLFAFASALRGFTDKNCMMDCPYGIMQSIDLEKMKWAAMIWSCTTMQQGYHPIILGLGSGYTDLGLAQEILDARIRYTQKHIDEFRINSKQLSPEKLRLLYSMMYDFGMFYAYKEIELALLQGSFNSDYLRMIQSQE